MFLEMHVRFYRSAAGSYGLRAWLAPRHQQTLLTPPGLVEAPESFERLTRASSRGYDVERIIAVDRQAAKEGEP
jgi:hypothetical protein